ncbi:hypothetical protein GCM10010327_64640 [Streptomyces nitrosporeus]|nr:hypothetical protein GCM10010327_64640 [Streptomyces nitrosporeus]
MDSLTAEGDGQLIGIHITYKTAELKVPTGPVERPWPRYGSAGTPSPAGAPERGPAHARVPLPDYSGKGTCARRADGQLQLACSGLPSA